MGNIFTSFFGTSSLPDTNRSLGETTASEKEPSLQERLASLEETEKADISFILERIATLERLEEQDRRKLESRIDTLRPHADINQDGIVSRKEMELFVTAQLHDREQQLQKLADRLDISEKKNALLSSEYSKLESHHTRLLEKIRQKRSRDIIAPSSTISTTAIDTFVNSMMEDPEVNIGWMIDGIEEKLYRKVMRILLTSIAKSLDTIEFSILGHSLNITMNPSKKNIDED